MKPNPTFQKATQLLTHPFSLIAILLLLLNDHLFRQLWPSWLTGKLGDFAWLFFFPFVLAALLSWLIPAHLPRQVQISGLLAFSLTATIFTLTKTLPVFHTAIVKLSSWALGFPVGWRMDASDLIALSALAAGWLLWQRTTVPHSSPAQTSKHPVWLLLSLTALLTVANAAQPESGISCLRSSDEGVLACSSFACYTSTDGGLSWSPSAESRPQDCPTWFYDQNPAAQVIEDPHNPSIQYRTNPGKSIERSVDGGTSWQVDYPLRPIEEARRAYSFKTSGGNAVVPDPPLDALADPSSGNIVFAMGFSGVLVRQANGTYTEEAIGNFTPSKPAFGELFLSVLSGEMILALVFGGLGIATISLPSKKHWLRITALVLGWLAWVVTCFIFPPAIQQGAYAFVFPNAGTLAAGVLALVMALEALIRKGVQSKPLTLRLGLVWVLSAVLYCLPFVLWLVNILPNYYLGLVFGILLGGGLIVFVAKQ